MMPFSVGRIDFINTAPVYHGIDTGRIRCPGRTVVAPPAALNRKLLAGEVQISAVSSVAYATAFPEWLLLPSLSISARGPVKSVLLCLRKPLGGTGKPVVGLSDKSATSKALTRILLEDHEGFEPVYEEVSLAAGIPRKLDGLLVIGDDALRLGYREFYPHAIDLGAFWVRWTGLPFVFGLWAVDRRFAESHPVDTARVAEALLASKNLGQGEINDVAQQAARRIGVPEELCRTYLKHIEYDLDQDQKKGLNLFYRLLKARGELPERVEPIFWRPAAVETRLGE